MILRSFGKFFGLAGLRLGFALAPGDMALALRDALGPWAVSGPALAIGPRALADRAWIGATPHRLGQDRARPDQVVGGARPRPLAGEKATGMTWIGTWAAAGSAAPTRPMIK